MANYKLQISFFTALLVGTMFLSFFILKPYLVALFIALILRIVFDSLHTRALNFCARRENLAALLSVGAVVILFIIPLALVGFFVFDDVRALYVKMISGEFDTNFIEQLLAPVNTFIQGIIPGFSFDVISYIKQGLGVLLSNVGSIFSGIVSFSFEFVLMILALFYLFRDGNRFKKYIVVLSPLSDSYDENILAKLAKAISSVLKGSLFVSCVQGVLAAIGFSIFGVPNAIVLGSITAVSALVPTVGTALVILPAIVYLFWGGMTSSAIGLIVWSIIVVGLVDNLLGPHLMARGGTIHPFIILIGVLGGLLFFGPVGFLAGPVIVTLLLTLLEMYPSIVSGKSN